MSDPGHLDPAIGLLELDSIVAGIVAGDAMAKSSPISALYAGTVHPGRYLVLVGGDTASVEVALEAAGTAALIDSLFLPDVHPAVLGAITTSDVAAPMHDDALGMIETATSATSIVAADAGLKAARVALLALRLADDLGGKAYCLFAGEVAEIEAAVEAGLGAVDDAHVFSSAVIPQLHAEMRDNLATELRFNHHLRLSGGSG